MQDFKIAPELISKRVRKIKNWTAPGDNELHGFWLKHLISFHKQLSKQLNHILQRANIGQRLTTGKSHFIMKDPAKGVVPYNNYRPITCWPIVFNLLSGIIADEIMQHLLINKQLSISSEPQGQRRCTKGIFLNHPSDIAEGSPGRQAKVSPLLCLWFSRWVR